MLYLTVSFSPGVHSAKGYEETMGKGRLRRGRREDRKALPDNSANSARNWPLRRRERFRKHHKVLNSLSLSGLSLLKQKTLGFWFSHVVSTVEFYFEMGHNLLYRLFTCKSRSYVGLLFFYHILTADFGDNRKKGKQ